MKSFSEFPFCNNLQAYSRRKTIEVQIGDLPMGGSHPIRVQSMTTVDTMDTKGSVEQCIRMIASGCEYIRITAPSIKEAENLQNIKDELRKRGYSVPLVADIHFTPNAAEVAARIVEKVRINPGNYADKKKFDLIEYNDQQYQAELERIREKFTPLVQICKQYGTAMRIGTNHGSLSDRILSRYGDTPFGMVESAMEFLRICEDLGYFNIVLSMKSSNPQVMVQAYRLLVATLDAEGLKPYPLHLGVTEAGDGEDGRVKSAMGIGTLLEDGLGDTVRVSLTEDPEFEAPVALKLVNRYSDFNTKFEAPSPTGLPFHYEPYSYTKHITTETDQFGEGQLPKVIADYSSIPLQEASQLKPIGHHYLSATDKWTTTDTGADVIYVGSHLPSIELHSNLAVWCDSKIYETLKKTKKDCLPVIELDELHTFNSVRVLKLPLAKITLDLAHQLKKETQLILLIQAEAPRNYKALRAACFLLKEAGLKFPLVFGLKSTATHSEMLQLTAPIDLGGLFIDGFGDGIMLFNGSAEAQIKNTNSVSFGVLQASRVRMSRTEYISCPSCGRTLFDLQDTTAMIRKRTNHLKGVKIGIMGCIVNGPGEMADADFGYVGSGVGKITLYKGQEVVKRSVPTKDAVNELIEIIKADGRWIEPQTA